MDSLIIVDSADESLPKYTSLDEIYGVSDGSDNSCKFSTILDLELSGIFPYSSCFFTKYLLAGLNTPGMTILFSI